MKRKRIVSKLLVFVLVLSMMPMTVFAGDLVDKSQLSTAVDELDALLATVVGSSDGADVETDQYWVSTNTYDSATMVLTIGNEILNDSAVDQATVDFALMDVNDQINAIEAEKAYGTNDGTSTVDKSQLSTAVDELDALLLTVVSSVDGTDVDTDQYWVGTNLYDSATMVLTIGNEILNDSAVDQTTVDFALMDVNDQINAIEAEKAYGTSDGTSTVDKSQLSTAVDELDALLATVVGSSDGTDVDTDQYWVSTNTYDSATIVLTIGNEILNDSAVDQTTVDFALMDANDQINAIEAEKAYGTNGETSTVDKSQLSTAVDELDALLLTVVSSVDGTDVDTDQYWVGTNLYDSATMVLAIGNEILNDSAVDQTTVDFALADVSNQISNIETEKSYGSYEEEIEEPVDTNALDSAIGSLQTLIATLVTSEDGTDIDPEVEWITQTTMDTAEQKIVDATAVLNDDAVTQLEVDNMASSVEDMIATVQNEIAYGTYEEPDEDEDDSTTTPSRPSGGSGGSIGREDESELNIERERVDGVVIYNITINEEIFEEILEDESVKGKVLAAVKDKDENVSLQIKDSMLNKMSDKSAKILVKNSFAEYLINSVDLNNMKKDVVKDKEKPADIKIEIKKAGQKQKNMVVDPVSFDIVVETEEENLKINKFDKPVERSISLKSVDAELINTISTAVVVNEDGTYSHVPTILRKIGNDHAAYIKSLTNSTYAVVTNDIKVESVENHWAKEVVNKMASKYILKDVEDFEPNASITRADFARYIVSAIGLDSYQNDLTKNFTDVEKTRKSIYVAAEYGIVNGYEDGSFRPEQTITREEAMTMYARAMDLVEYQGQEVKRLETFKDKEDVSSWAYKHVEKAVNGKLFNGRKEDELAPKGNLTYAESLKAIDNLLINAELTN